MTSILFIKGHFLQPIQIQLCLIIDFEIDFDFEIRSYLNV